MITSDPIEAVKDADIVYTDTWVSMGMEEEKKKRMRVFMTYQVNDELFSKAQPDALFILPSRLQGI